MRYGVQQRQGVVGGLGTAVPGPLPRAGEAAKTAARRKHPCPQVSKFLIRMTSP